MPRVAVLDDYLRVAHRLVDWTSIPDGQVEFFHDSVHDAGALARRLRSFDVLVTIRERTRLTRDVLERLPELKLVAGTGRFQSHVDLAAATRLGIVVTGTGGGERSADSTTELTWGLILACMRHIPWEDRQLRHGMWQTRLGQGLVDKTLGILGMGRIGARVARVGKAFGMRVQAWGPTLSQQRAAEHGARYVAWDHLFAGSDIVTVHLLLTEQSRGWIGPQELALMPHHAYLINTARSAIVQQQALLNALQTGRIAGAGLDVYDEEPMEPNNPLLDLDNVVLTPHLGYTTAEVLRGFFAGAIDSVRSWQAGNPVHVQNPKVLEGPRRGAE